MIKKSKKLMTSLLLALSLIAVFPVSNAFATDSSIQKENTVNHSVKDDTTLKLDGPKLKENTDNSYFKNYIDYTLLPSDDPIRKEIESNPILKEYRDYERFIKNQCIPTENDSIVYNPNDGKYYGTGASQEYGFAKPSNSHVTDAKPGNSQVTEVYYASDDGSLVKDKWVFTTNSSTDGTHWEYYGSDYKGVTGYQTINGKHYYFGSTGNLFAGWKKRAADGGEPSKDWKERLANSRWYYYGEDGEMKEGWVSSGGKWYYIYSNGLMASDTTTPDGYRVDKNGVWTS